MIDWKKFKGLLAERKVVAALVLVAIVAIWMFRFETFGYQGLNTARPAGFATSPSGWTDSSIAKYDRTIMSKTRSM